MASAGSIVFLLLPILIGALVDDLSFSEEQAGTLASSYFAGYLLICVCAVFLINQFSQASLAFFAYSGFSLGLICTAFSVSYALLAISLFIGGAGAGLLFGLAVAEIGRSQKSERDFGIMLFTQQLCAALLLFALPQIIAPRWGFQGMMLVLALFFLWAIPTVKWLSDEDGNSSQLQRDTDASRLGPMLWGVAALAVYFGALSGVWAFVERIASSQQISAENIGLALAFSMLGGIVGALAVAFQGNRFGWRAPIVLSSVVFVLLLAGFNQPFNVTAFALLSFVFSLFWNYVLGYQLSALTALDEDGRFAVLLPAAQALGAVAGPFFAGMIVMQNSYGQMLLIAAMTMLVATVAFLKLLGAAASRQS